jgi:hypothetical protein
MVWVCGLDSSGCRLGPVAGFFKHGNEPSVFTQRRISYLAERMSGTWEIPISTVLVTLHFSNCTCWMLPLTVKDTHVYWFGCPARDRHGPGSIFPPIFSSHVSHIKIFKSIYDGWITSSSSAVVNRFMTTSIYNPACQLQYSQKALRLASLMVLCYMMHTIQGR